MDWHVSHYVKVLLDEIFGLESMINEIVWCYGGGTGTRRHFHRKHDLILWYAKGPDYTFNPQYRPYSPGTVQGGLPGSRETAISCTPKRADAGLVERYQQDSQPYRPRKPGNFPPRNLWRFLQRIIAAASNPGDLVGDFYAGSATVARFVRKSGRYWVTCDNSPIAIDTAMKRLIRMPARPFTVREHGGFRPGIWPIGAKAVAEQ